MTNDKPAIGIHHHSLDVSRQDATSSLVTLDFRVALVTSAGHVLELQNLLDDTLEMLYIDCMPGREAAETTRDPATARDVTKPGSTRNGQTVLATTTGHWRCRCGQAFDTQYDLAKHVQYTPQAPAQSQEPTCTCGRTFRSGQALGFHIGNAHQRGDMHHAKDGEHRAMQDFACVCGYFTKSADMLVKHLRSAPKYSDDRHEACV